MNWQRKRVTVVTKAYPEKSRKHGMVACTAGLTDEGEWIRLYPIQIGHFIGKDKISKFDIIEVECKPDRDKLGRRENFKVRPDSIKILDKSLTLPKPDWERRNRILLSKCDRSIETLAEGYEDNKRSLGIIRPRRIHDFIKTERLEIYENSWSFVETLDGMKIPNMVKIPHIFKYEFSCYGCEDDKHHNMQCEDWELFESYRSWGQRYKDPNELWKKLRGRYYGWMLGKRNLHLIMGMYSQYPTWFIIGLYYPPRNREKKPRRQN